MRIALMGQAAFGEKVLAALLDAGEEVAVVFCPPDPPDKPSGLRTLGEQNGIPVIQPRKMRDPEVTEAYEKYQPDLNVMAFVTDIVPQRILDAPHWAASSITHPCCRATVAAVPSTGRSSWARRSPG